MCCAVLGSMGKLGRHCIMSRRTKRGPTLGIVSTEHRNSPFVFVYTLTVLFHIDLLFSSQMTTISTVKQLSNENFHIMNLLHDSSD